MSDVVERLPCVIVGGVAFLFDEKFIVVRVISDGELLLLCECRVPLWM